MDIDFFGFWEDCDGSGGGMDAAAGFGDGDALDAVDAGLVFEFAIDVCTFDEEGNFFQAAEF